MLPLHLHHHTYIRAQHLLLPLIESLFRVCLMQSPTVAVTMCCSFTAYKFFSTPDNRLVNLITSSRLLQVHHMFLTYPLFLPLIIIITVSTLLSAILSYATGHKQQQQQQHRLRRRKNNHTQVLMKRQRRDIHTSDLHPPSSFLPSMVLGSLSHSTHK